jgi:hypothetical protein
MQRDRYNAVTLEVLVPASPNATEKEYVMGYGRMPFRRFSKEDLNPKAWKQAIDSDQGVILACVEALQALETGDSLTLQKACLTLMKSRLFQTSLSETVPLPEGASEKMRALSKAIQSLAEVSKDLQGGAEGLMNLLVRDADGARATFAAELSRHLEGVRLVLRYRDREMIPTLVCPTLSAAFLLRTLMSAVGANVGIRLCPNCGNVFLQKRPDQNYCSVRCREAHRVARFRARQKSRPKSK